MTQSMTLFAGAQPGGATPILRKRRAESRGFSRLFPPTLKEMRTKLGFMKNHWADVDGHKAHLLLQGWAAFSINIS